MQKGFSLIELLIVLVIIGILTSIVLPGYTQYVTQSRRSEGVAQLLQVMRRQEQYFTNELTYTTDLSLLGYTLNASSAVESEGGTYFVTAAACQVPDPNDPSQTIADNLNNCIILTAAPQGVQAGDGNLTLDSLGNRTPVGFWQ